MWENSDKRSCQRIIPLPDYNADIVHGRKHLSKDDEEMINGSGQNSDLAYSYSSDVDNKENDEEESIKLSPVRASVYRHVLNEGTKFEVHRIDERFASQMSSPSFASSTLGQKKAAKRLTRSPPRPSLHRQGSGIPRHGRSVSKRDLMLSPPQASTVDPKRMLMSPPNEMNSGLRQRKIPPSPQDTPNTINLGSVFSPSTKSLKSIPFMQINSITDLNFSPPCSKKLATIDCFSDLPVVGEENTPLIKNKSTNSLNRQIKTGAPALSPKLESSSFTPNNIASARADAPKNSANKFAAAVQNSIREGLKKANQARTFGTAQMNGHPNKFGRGDSNSSNNRDVPARNSFTQLSSQSLVPEEPRYAAPSDLHKCCHEAENLEDLNFFAKEHFPHAKSLTPRGTTRFRSSPRQKSQILQWITQKDELGRLPIHVLSENKRLIRCNFECDANDFVYEETLYSLQEPNATSTRTIGQKNSSLKGNLHASFPFNRSPPLKMVGPKSNTIRSSSTAPLNLVDSQEYDLKGFAWDFIEQLVHLHPNGLTERDEEGHIPFVGSITRWVNFVYVKDTNSRQVNSRRNGVPQTGGMVVGGNEGYGISLNFHGVSHAINKLSAMKKTAQHSAKVHSSKNCLYDSSPFSTHDNTGKDSIPSFSNSKSLIGVFDNCVAPEETYIQTNIPHSTATLTESLAHHADLERKFESPSALSRPPLGKKSGTPIQQLPTSRRPPTKTPIKAESEASLQSLSSSNSTHKEDAREKQFPKRVKISPHVEWCLHMLSALIEHLEDSEQEERFSLLTAASNNNHTPVAALETPVRRDRVRIQAIGEKRISAFRGNVIKICHDMVHAVASIPFFIKTLLMIEDEAKREYIFSLTVVRRVVLNKASIGKWLTSMLSSERKSVPKRAVQYLELLSDVTGEDAMGASWAGSSSRDSKSIAQRQSDLYQTVGELDNLIPSMLALDEQMMEQAATSNIVKQVLDNMISRPFAVSVVFFDMLFLALLLIAFRCSVHAYLNWFSPNYILKWLYAANSCIFYFIIRELGKFVSFTMIARHLYGLKHFWSFWNIVDFASIAVTCTSVIILRMNVAAINGYPLDERSDLARFLFTISTGLLWLRVLGLAKTINMQLATFVLAIVQITRDIVQFLLILLAAVFCFAQMFYTLLVPKDCGDPVFRLTSTACNQTEYYLTVYTILLGDFGRFEREDFTSVFSVLLIVLFTFMVVVILLNVLIAIVGDSHERCLLRSERLFGRARVVLLAELVSFQSLFMSRDNLHPSDSSNFTRSSFYDNYCLKVPKWCHSRSKGGKVFLCFSVIVWIAWATWDLSFSLSTSSQAYLNYSIVAVVINALLLYGIVQFLRMGAGDDKGNGGNSLTQTLAMWYDKSVQNTMRRLLGTSADRLLTSKSNALDHEWKGRLHHLQKEMHRISSESAARAKSEWETFEQAQRESETRLRGELAAVMEQVRASETRMNNKIDSIQDSIHILIEVLQHVK